MSKVFFTNGGADANEHAVRMARLHTGRFKVLSAYRSYHGATGLAMMLTGDPRRWSSEPGSPGVVHYFGPYEYRSPFGSDNAEQESQRALDHLESVLVMEGPHTVAAVLLEPVVGTNGVLVPPPGYLQGVRQLCDRYGVLLICDEVMCGFGRIGEWFAVDAWSVRPDLITFAKGVNSGYVPLGGVLISDEVTQSFAKTAYPGGLTYSGHPLACASALSTLDVYEGEGVFARVRELGTQTVAPALAELMRRHRCVGDV
jgi:taurine--2-oxoglutarate transaminase